MQIVLVVTPENAPALHGQATPTQATKSLTDVVTTAGYALEPLHPNPETPALAVYFTIAVPDESTANRLIADFLQNPAVDGAYVKPVDELPM
jgi:hypothetical protein